MKIGLSRFEYYLEQIQNLLTQAAKQKNPALWLYQNNFRTPLFMLEGLAKMYSYLHNKRKFEQLKEQFKLLEDVLGAIDYYDVFAKKFVLNKKIPTSVIHYLQAQTREKIQSLNEWLVEKKWIGSDINRITKIKKKLKKIDWQNEKEELTAIYNFYGSSIYQITEFIKTDKLQFKNVESDVHELRRKLRWLSIYPQAFGGGIQLSAPKKVPQNLSKYLTQEITESPFNKMPNVGIHKYLLMIDKNYFYALSWMIAELGKLKDSGLSIIVIKEALQQTNKINEATAYKKAYQMLGSQHPQLPTILAQAQAICKTYFDEHCLENLVLNIVKIK